MGTQKPSAFSFESSEKNPFLAAFEPQRPFGSPTDEVPADAPEGSYTYRLVQSGPAVPAEECETPAAAVEVLIRWGATVLHVAHLSPVVSFYVGEDAGKDHKSGFFLPEEKLGARRLPLVLADGGSVHLVVPAGATGTIALAGAPAKDVRDLVASGAAEPCAAAPGAHRVALPEGARAALELNGLSFEVSAVRAGRSTGRIKLDAESLPYTGLSLLLHASVLAAAALFVPSMAMADEDGISLEQQVEMYAMLNGEAVREPDAMKDEAREADVGEHGDVGMAGPGEAGKAGSQTSRESNRRFATRFDGPESQLSRAEALRDVDGFGAIGLLNAMNGAMGSPVSPFARDLPSGLDAMNGRGNMFGETIGDAMGVGGLTLSGLGDGGGNPFGVIGVGRVGTVGHDFVGGVGRSGAFVGGRHHVASPPSVRIGQTISSGRLPPEIIQRVIRQSFGRFRACYEGGLRGNPNLQGRVAVRFVIGRDGAVSNVANGGSDLPDAGVVSCVARSFYGLSFPPPDSGIVTVTYPIVFSPAN